MVLADIQINSGTIILIAAVLVIVACFIYIVRAL